LSPWRPDARVLVVGDVFVDYSIADSRLRLGGVFHAARALAAFEATYALGYVAPAYLDDAIQRFGTQLRSERSIRIGLVAGSPSVILVRDAQEAGEQGYDEPLRRARTVTWDTAALDELVEAFRPTDVLIMAGYYDTEEVARTAGRAGARLHCDTQYEANVSLLAAAAERPLDTVFVSTSSAVFTETGGGDPDRLRTAVGSRVARNILLKENRGGSRLIGEGGDTLGEGAAFPTTTAHSIGVGDCFDCAWILAPDDEHPTKRLTRASYLASLYASTWSHTNFVANARGAVARDSLVTELSGVRFPWELRPLERIYIAAPDFPDIDTRSLDELEHALQYHNFSPIRPVRECGLYKTDMNAEEVGQLYACDRALLDSAALVIAVPLFVDPGTYTELGVAHALGIPTVLWDRSRAMRNVFAAKTATRVCHTLGEVIDATFALMPTPGTPS
jgi:nucleoside 2-deoxyribosyltransferase